MMTREELATLTGADVVDASGERIGAVEDIYYDDATGGAEWIGIGTGVFGMRRRVVPVEGAQVDGGQVRVAVAADLVKDSPTVADDQIAPAQEREIREHYGLPARSAAEAPHPAQLHEEWERSGEDPTVGTRSVDEEHALHIRRWIPDDPDEGRLRGPAEH